MNNNGLLISHARAPSTPAQLASQLHQAPDHDTGGHDQTNGRSGISLIFGDGRRDGSGQLGVSRAHGHEDQSRSSDDAGAEFASDGTGFFEHVISLQN